MRLILSSALCCLSLFAPVLGFGQKQALAADRAVERLTSPAGHEFLFFAMPEAKEVSFEISWASDWAYREDRNPAIPYIGTQLMLAGGAGRYDAAEFGERFADLISEGNLFTMADEVRGQLVVGVDDVDQAVELANRVLATPRLEEEWLARIQGSLKAELEQARTQSANLGWEAVRRAVLGDSPVNAFLSLDDPRTIEAVTREDVLAWWKDTFRATPIRIAVAGKFTAEEAAKAVDSLLAGLPAGQARTKPEVSADFRPRTIILVRPEAEKTVLGFLGPLPPTNAGGEIDDLIIMNILAGGEQARLFKAARSQLRASYGFSAGSANYTRALQFFIMTGEVDRSRLTDARAMVRETYENLRSNAVGDDEVEALKAVFSAEMTENLAYPDVAARLMLESELDGFDQDRVLATLDELAKVSADTVRQRLQMHYPTAGQLIEIIVTAAPPEIENACIISSIAEVDRCL